MAQKGTRRVLVVYYSYTGETRALARAVAKAVGADVEEIHLAKPLPKWKPLVYVLGGFQAKARRKPALQPLKRNPQNYDTIFIGTPVWASALVPAVRSWLAAAELKGKRIACFASAGGGSPGLAFTDIHALLPENTFASDRLFQGKAPAAEKSRAAREWALAALKA